MIRHSPSRRNRLAQMLAPALLMLLAAHALAQQPAPAPAVSATDTQELKVDAPDKKLFFTTTRIETSSADGKLTRAGTGFIFNYDAGDHRPVQFIVTSRQVVDSFASATLFFVPRRNGKPSLGESCQVTVPNLRELLFDDPDPKIDVALIPLRLVLQRSYTNSSTPYLQMLSQDMIPSRTAAEELRAIQPVTFVGYPDGLRDETNLLPVARRGFTASPYVVDFDGLPVFLIDAPIAPGSAGSPVVVLEQDSVSPRPGVITAGSLRFLGLLSGEYFTTVNGEAKFQPPTPSTMPVAKDARSGNIAAVVKVGAILNTISQYLKAHPTIGPDDSDGRSKN